MSEGLALESLGAEQTRWPLEALSERLSQGAVEVRDVGMEGFSYLVKRLTDRSEALKSRPLIAVTPTLEEAVRLGQNLRACLSGGGPRVGEARRAVYVWDEPAPPFESMRPSASAQGERLALLAMIAQGRAASIQVMSALTFARRVVSAEHLSARTHRLVVGEEVDREALIAALAVEGYERVSVVNEPCTFLARGDRLDLYSPHLSAPLRVSFFGDEVESICTFRPETQRRDRASLPEVTIPPLREAPLTAELAVQCGDGVVSLADELLEARPELEACGIDPNHDAIIKLADDLTDGVAVPDLEALLPCFFLEGLVSIRDFIADRLGAPWCIVWDRARSLEVLEARFEHWSRLHEEALRAGRLTSPAEDHLLTSAEVSALWRAPMTLSLTPYELEGEAVSLYLPSHLPLRQRLDATRSSGDALAPLVEAMEVWVEMGSRVGVICQTMSQRERLTRRLGGRVSIYAHSLADWLLGCQASDEGRFEAGVYLMRGTLSAGFHDSEAQLSLISAAEIFNTPLSARRQSRGQLGVDVTLERLLRGGDVYAASLASQRSADLTQAHGAQGRASSSEPRDELRDEARDEARDQHEPERDPWDNGSVEGIELYSDSELDALAERESPFINSLQDLEVNDPIVHLDYGIGMFRGLVQIEDQGVTIDFVQLEFAKRELVLLPVYRLHLVQKFIGTRTPKLSVKGGADWKRSLSEAQTSAEDQARELLEVYAERARATGFAYSTPGERYAEFEARFPYTETRDQLRAIQRILKEMCAPQPMDHLLCGDVGFGKTEVAMRAAMKAVLDEQQVVVLVPTTILAAQHAKNFAERFRYTSFKVAQLSRFVTPEQRKEVKDGLRRGEIDIVIGTHGVLHQSVEIPRLGLLILDEEHRFGVKDKERFKSLRANLDVLSMTATPIPRTLHMSLSGLRSMSVIATPPRDRLSVYTRMVRVNETVVREAVLYELRRGGQVFFVHNRVETIETRKRWLSSILPELSIGVAHGKMKPTELEQVMWSFTEGAFQLLLCTTLIENGIDIPRANTIMIDDANNFGISQLYQLRGRVGRSHERGRCFLLISPEALLSPEARTRLGAIQKFTELGSGFHIASQDLELRGAGELLGTKQKGHAQKVGLDLYARLLDQAMLDLREGQRPQRFDPHIALGRRVKGAIPPDYIDDVQERLRVYRRISRFAQQEQIPLLLEELLDRFGEPPAEMISYLNLQRVVIMAKALGLHDVRVEKKRLIITFHPQTTTPTSVIERALKLPESPLARLSEDELVYPVPLELQSQLERAAVQALLHLYDLLPQQRVL